MNEVKKPLLVAREELLQAVTNDITSSGLPLIIVLPLMESLVRGLNEALATQYNNEKVQYEAALKEKTEELDGKDN